MSDGTPRPWHSDGPGFLRSHGRCSSRDWVAWCPRALHGITCFVFLLCGCASNILNPEESERHSIVLHLLCLDFSERLPAVALKWSSQV